jgi:hypothetical protein
MSFTYKGSWSDSCTDANMVSYRSTPIFIGSHCLLSCIRLPQRFSLSPSLPSHHCCRRRTDPRAFLSETHGEDSGKFLPLTPCFSLRLPSCTRLSHPIYPLQRYSDSDYCGSVVSDTLAPSNENFADILTKPLPNNRFI